MSELLRRELVVRPHRILARHLIAVGLGCGLIGAGTTLVAHSLAHTPPPAGPALSLSLSLPIVAATTAAAAPPASSVPVAPVADPGARASEISLVFDADGETFAQISELPDSSLSDEDGDPRQHALPAHGPVRLAERDSEGPHVAIAEVEAAALSAEQRAWLGRSLIVDGSCAATVTGFALVSRIVGEPGYLGDGSETAWTATSVWNTGTLVLGARLSDCGGSYARDATLPPVVVPAVVDPGEPRAAVLIAAARAVVLASPAAIALGTDWAAAQMTGAWTAQAETRSGVVRHPQTGETWVWTHAVLPFECGAPQGSLWGLFRVADDGTLRTAALGTLGAVGDIGSLIDIDGDGELEVLGHTGLTSDPVIATPDGDEIARLSVPFLGCPC